MDISQIRKYLNGELDARAMHQLERAAQDDPFLMDALEGLENAAADQQAHLTDLDHCLQQRIDQSKVRRLIPWKYYAAAASVLIVFTLGYLLWPATRQIPQEKNLVAAKNQTPPPADHPTILPDTVLKAPAKESLIAANTPRAARSMASQATIAPAPATVQDTKAETRLDEPVTKADAKVAVQADKQFGYNSDAKATVPKADTVQYAAAPYNAARYSKIQKPDTAHALKEITIAGYGTQKKALLTGNVAASSQMLQGKLPGAQVTTPDHISGVVMDQMGVPLPGVSVKGSQNATLTDASGRFSLVAKDQETLDIRYIGYTGKQVKAKANDNLKITLDESQQSLSEVVVVGYGKTVKPDKNAHPRTGWDNYNQYLKRGAVADDGKAGTVRLSFTVNGKGALGDFKIISGLSDATNQQAINLVKNGPAWVPETDGKTKTLKLKIRFSKQ